MGARIARKWIDTDKSSKMRIVARLLPPESSAIDLVSREVGIGVCDAGTLAGGGLGQWIRPGEEPRAGRRRRGCKR